MKYLLVASMLSAVGCSAGGITKDSRHLVCLTPMGAIEAEALPGILDITDTGQSYQITDIEQKKQILISKTACVLFRDAK